MIVVILLVELISKSNKEEKKTHTKCRTAHQQIVWIMKCWLVLSIRCIFRFKTLDMMWCFRWTQDCMLRTSGILAQRRSVSRMEHNWRRCPVLRSIRRCGSIHRGLIRCLHQLIYRCTTHTSHRNMNQRYSAIWSEIYAELMLNSGLTVNVSVIPVFSMCVANLFYSNLFILCICSNNGEWHEH